MTEKSNDVVLKVAGISKRFGGLQALSDVGITIQRGQVYGLIGPNGAGKTTFFNAISGVQPPTSGTLHCGGDDLTGKGPHHYAAHGIARTFQTPRVFPDMTVRDNVRFGMQFAGRHRQGPVGLRNEDEILAMLGLSALADRPAADVTPSQQRLLEIGMALGTRPRLLLLDEVAAGLTEAEVDAMAQRIRRLRDDWGLTVVWIEHAV
uniref:ABC transporter ATP-binding protein n=1 Tax=Acidovorax soli TaxID=592050 RepID=UPI0032B22F33